MNDFCRYCCGGNKQEVFKCLDKKCPFYMFKRANLDWQERRKEHNKKKNIKRRKIKC